MLTVLLCWLAFNVLYLVRGMLGASARERRIECDAAMDEEQSDARLKVCTGDRSSPSGARGPDDVCS